MRREDSLPEDLLLLEEIQGLPSSPGSAELLAKVKQKGDAADQVLKKASWNALLKPLLGDRTIVTTAVRQQGDALEYAAKELKDDYEVVMAAVKQNGVAIRFASHRLKLDPEVGKAAVEQDERAQYWMNMVCTAHCFGMLSASYHDSYLSRTGQVT